MKVRTLAQVLRLLLDETNMSANRLSKITGVGNSAISSILSGNIDPSITTMEKLVRGAGKSWVWLDERLEAVKLPRIARANRRGPYRPRKKPDPAMKGNEEGKAVKKAQTLAAAIDLLLVETQLTVHELGKITGLSNTPISRILGGNRYARVKTIEKLLRAAGKTWAWLDEHLEPIKLRSVQAKRKPDRPREYPERNPLRFQMR